MNWTFGLILGLATFAGEASAHDFGCDGKPVPTGVKSACCGKADAHLLGQPWLNSQTGEVENWPMPEQNGRGDWTLTIDGSRGVWAYSQVQLSTDGCTWAFWSRYDPHGCSYEAHECNPTADKHKWGVSFYCLLMPMDL